MAQHIPIELFKQKAIQKIAKSIHAQRYFTTSMKFEELPLEYAEGDDRAFVTYRTVPESIVAGGRATFEVHCKQLKYGLEVTKIYLVA